MKKNKISIVIPVYNSENILMDLYQEIDISMKKAGLEYELILVDDASKDNSFDIMKKLYNFAENIAAIKFSSNFGQQNAIMCGLRYAKHEYIVTMDDDLQHPPSEIPKLIEEISKGYDAVYGIPEQKMHETYRNLGSFLTGQLFNLLLNKPRDIKIGSFRAMTRELCDKTIKSRKSFVYLSAIMLRYTKNISNITVRHNKRQNGKTNYSILKLIRLFTKLAVYYSLPGDMKILETSPQYEISEIYIRS